MNKKSALILLIIVLIAIFIWVAASLIQQGVSETSRSENEILKIIVNDSETSIQTVGEVCDGYSVELDREDTVFAFLNSIEGQPANPAEGIAQNKWIIYSYNTIGLAPDTEADLLRYVGQELPILNLKTSEVADLTEDEYLELKLCGKHNYFNRGLDGSEPNESAIEYNRDRDFANEIEVDKQNASYEISKQELSDLKELIM